jgi:hypothetical protein
VQYNTRQERYFRIFAVFLLNQVIPMLSM